ncbi:MAG TPA: LamG domain-containing protein [Candidatus Paceibacterota bacterium]|nr:LamG domain-containing protein [Candidatus Paceibacterota bacterium]
MHLPRKAFTLIELLVVIAIIAILAIVVVLTLNPAELLRQSRDANRVSDMSTLNSALNLYLTDTGGAGALGTSSIAYVSLPDTSSTCGSWGLPASSACASSTSSRNINSTGWLPVNFTAISAGSPLSSLPLDPTNQSSTGLFYTYTASNGQYELIAPLESSKYQASVTGALGPGIATQGSTNPVSSLAGWWTLNEGTGTTAYDSSGSNNNGTWHGTQAGTNGYYSPGIVGAWSGAFYNSGATYINFASQAPLAGLSGIGSYTIITWIDDTNPTGYRYPISLESAGSQGTEIYENPTPASITCYRGNGSGAEGVTTGVISSGVWYLYACVYNGSTLSNYLNGVFVTSTPSTRSITLGNLTFGEESLGGNVFIGQLDSVRIYNRALSAAEIQAIYSARR